MNFHNLKFDSTEQDVFNHIFKVMKRRCTDKLLQKKMTLAKFKQCMKSVKPISKLTFEVIREKEIIDFESKKWKRKLRKLHSLILETEPLNYT